MVHDAVDDRSRHLIVSEDQPPAGELQVRGDHDRLSLVGIDEYLEHEARPVGVERQEPQRAPRVLASRSDGSQVDRVRSRIIALT